ncbi:hypothetical protein OKW45_005371 [Paraburkholderia sp. WSM4175]|uniref:hypothetical protein n=1 Tax=Paraburkholderia sp. WSM4175 TaxID=2991072 RepID=UPI003D1F4F27
MANEIVLPSGTGYVATADVPELLARALHPETTGQPLTVSYFDKTARPGATGETAKWNGWPIDDDDRKEVAARDAGISDASFVRLRRAMDWVACAQSVLESMRVETEEAYDGETVMPRQLQIREAVMRDAMELLARELSTPI